MCILRKNNPPLRGLFPTLDILSHCDYNVYTKEEMQIAIIKIGNSKGVRLPKTILEQCGITDSVEMEVHEGEIILKPRPAVPRQGWREQFAAMAGNGDDALVISDALDLDHGDWEW